MTFPATAGTGLAASQLQLLGLLALLSLAPFAVMMLTSYAKIVVVFSLLKAALGAPQAPPGAVLSALAAALTLVVMTPTVEASIRAASLDSGWPRDPSAMLERLRGFAVPFRDFALKHGSASERASLMRTARELRTGSQVTEEDVSIVIAAFVLTELKEAFTLGFLLFLPFMVVDMVAANVLLALGMQSLHAGQVSLPFKLLLFVVADGWSLVSRGLLLGYR